MYRKKVAKKNYLNVPKGPSRIREISKEISDGNQRKLPRTSSSSSFGSPTNSGGYLDWRCRSKTDAEPDSSSENSGKFKIRSKISYIPSIHENIPSIHENNPSIQEDNPSIQKDSDSSTAISSIPSLQSDVSNGRKNKSIFNRIRKSFCAARNHAISYFQQVTTDTKMDEAETSTTEKSPSESSEPSTAKTSFNGMGDVSYCDIKSVFGSVTCFDSRSEKNSQKLSLFKDKCSSFNSDLSLSPFRYDGMDMDDVWERYRYLYKTRFDVNVFRAGRFFDDFVNLWDIIVLVKRFKDSLGKTHVYYSRANDMSEIPQSLQKIHQMFLEKKIEIQKDLEKFRIRKLMLTDVELSKCVAEEEAAYQRRLESRAPGRITSTESVFRRLTRQSVANIYIGEDGKLLVADPDSESCFSEVEQPPVPTKTESSEIESENLFPVMNKGIYQRSTFPSKLIPDDQIRIPMKNGCWQSTAFSKHSPPRNFALSHMSTTFDIIAGEPGDDYFDFLEGATKLEKIQSCEDLNDLWEEAEKLLTAPPESYKLMRHSLFLARNNGI